MTQPLRHPHLGPEIRLEPSLSPGRSLVSIFSVSLMLRQGFKRLCFAPLPPLASSSSSSGSPRAIPKPSPLISAMAASPRPREGTPPPVIGKAGRYTIFITPPPTPRPSSNSPKTPTPSLGSIPSPRPVNAAAIPVKVPPSPPPPPVQVPPQQFDKPASRKGSESSFGFFWAAIAKVQDVHSSLDEYLADWFGLNQSKYQWALNDYYESKGLGKDDSKQKELATKRPSSVRA